MKAARMSVQHIANIAVLGSGEFFGYEDIFFPSNKRRLFTAHCKTNVKLLVCRREVF